MFARPPLHWFALSISGMLLFTVVAYLPGWIPFDMLGLFGKFLRYLAYDLSLLSKIGVAVAWLVHVAEACQAMNICRKNPQYFSTSDIKKWTFQTFLIGINSLRLLRKMIQEKKLAEKD